MRSICILYVYYMRRDEFGGYVEGVGGEGEKKFSQLYTITDFFSL